LDLNREQIEAVNSTNGPLLIFAGAGSGKTRVITNRIIRMVEELHIDPRKIVALSFTNKSAREMKERIYKLIGRKKIKGIELSTFHALGLKICKLHIEKIGFKTPFLLQTPNDLEIIISDILKKYKIDSKLFPIKQILSQLSYYKNSGKKRDETSEWSLLIDRIYEDYNSTMRGMNALDFDDLILKPIEIIKSSEDVRHYYHNKLKYFMIDEFQDTNEVQYNLIKQLLGNNNNICVVGDDDQSIYGFRGSNKDLILNFENDFPGTKVINLLRNYRSSETILSVANSLIKNNKNRREKILIGTIQGNFLPIVIERENEREEAIYIVDQIQDLIVRNKVRGGEISILFRTNYQSRPFEEELRLRSIPYKLIGAYNFFDRKEVKDLIAYIRIVANHNDDLSILRILNYPKRGLGQNTQLKIVEKASELEINIFEVLIKICEIPEFIPEIKRAAVSKIYELVNLIQKFNREFYTQPRLSEVLKNLIKEVSFETEISMEEDDEKVIKARMLNLSELVNMMSYFEIDWDEEGKPTLFDFLMKLSILSDDDDNDSKEDSRVQLMTMHLSKGLEFDSVFLSGMEEGILPSSRSTDDSGIEEERRLLYVGITRAKTRLYLTRAKERKKFGESIPSIPSRFLEEIDKELVRWIGEETQETEVNFLDQLEMLRQD
jgi:DNA helicase II / ATP-dependent DNA helicase PcrA